MNWTRYRLGILVFSFAAALFIASPAMQQLLVLPHGDSFSELGLLGSYGNASEYPSNVVGGESYTVYVYVGNELGHSAYYLVQAKWLNSTQFAFDSVASSIYNSTCFLDDKQSIELPLTFSLDYSYQTPSVGSWRLDVQKLILNSAAVAVSGWSTTWDDKEGGFLGYLVFELWMYDVAAGGFQSSGSSVNLRLNMTVT